MPLDRPASVRLQGQEITLVLSEGATVELRAFDIAGRQHGNVLSGTYSAGIHHIPAPWTRPSTRLWLQARLPSGRILRSFDFGTVLLTPGKSEGMRRIPQGRYLIGSPGEEVGRFGDERLHFVTLSSFWIDTVETTRRQFRTLMGFDPSGSGCMQDECPVENVSWNEAILYCNARSRANGRDSAYAWDAIVRDNAGDVEELVGLSLRQGSTGYRIPTEAQWEAVARAGSSTPWPWGGDSLRAADHAWFGENAQGNPHPVGTRRPSPWGLHDMTGNVWEWTWDWYGAYDTAQPLDPVGPPRGPSRTSRGGGWATSTAFLRSAFRNGSGPAHRDPQTGFRCVRPVQP